MKKIIPIIAATLLFISCSKNNDLNQIILEPNQKTLHFKDTYQIKATSNTKITYSVENDFHASVSNIGLVTVGRVGKTEITLKNEEDLKKEIITVTPKSNLYSTPDLKFGTSKANLIKIYGEPDYEKDDIIIYNNQYAYLFDKNEKMTSAAVFISTEYSSELGVFLNERYVLGTKDNNTYIYVNHVNLIKATVAVSASLTNSKRWTVIYIPYDSSKKEQSSSSKTLNLFEKLQNKYLAL